MHRTLSPYDQFAMQAEGSDLVDSGKVLYRLMGYPSLRAAFPLRFSLASPDLRTTNKG